MPVQVGVVRPGNMALTVVLFAQFRFRQREAAVDRQVVRKILRQLFGRDQGQGERALRNLKRKPECFLSLERIFVESIEVHNLQLVIEQVVPG